MAIPVVLADFQFLTREGMLSLIGEMQDFEVIRTVETPDLLEQTIKEVSPKVVVIDISDDNQFLVSKVKAIKGFFDGAFLVISNSQTKQFIQQLLAMGVKGILTKNCSEEEIMNGLHAVAKGNRFFCNAILDLVVEKGEKAEEDCEPTSLSAREYEVLELIARGHTTAEIADALHVSVHTINSHRKNILRKLNQRSPAELIVYAIESGLVRPTK